MKGNAEREKRTWASRRISCGPFPLWMSIEQRSCRKGKTTSIIWRSCTDSLEDRLRPSRSRNKRTELSSNWQNMIDLQDILLLEVDSVLVDNFRWNHFRQYQYQYTNISFVIWLDWKINLLMMPMVLMALITHNWKDLKMVQSIQYSKPDPKILPLINFILIMGIFFISHTHINQCRLFSQILNTCKEAQKKAQSWNETENLRSGEKMRVNRLIQKFDKTSLPYF